MSRLSWLKKEAEMWVGKDIISRGQGDRIVGLYSGDSKGRLVSVLLALGAVLLGAGVILFFASNWQYIPKWGKVSLVITPLILFYLSSYLTFDKYPKLSQALSLLGCIMFGSGIWLVAQIFHIDSHFPNGLLFWLLGVLPAAFLLKGDLCLGLGALLLGAWTVAEHSTSPVVILAAMLIFGAVFYLTYSLRSSFALVVSLLSSIVFINTEIVLIYENNYRFYDAGYLIPFVLLLAGSSLLYMSKHPVNKVKYFPFIYDITGFVVTGVSLLIMSFEFFPHYFLKLRELESGMVLLWTLYIIVAVLGSYAISRRRSDFKSTVKDNLDWLALDVLAFTMLLVPFGEFALMVTLNLFMFVWALLLIISGYRSQKDLYFTLGLLAFSAYTTAEYFNLFWKTLPKSLFFIAGGIVLIVGGWLMERQRQKVIHSWQEAEAPEHEEKP